MENNKEHISICACTFQRPKLLAKLLKSLVEQETSDNFTYCVIIVDNDPKQSARKIVEGLHGRHHIEVKYYNQPKIGLSYARNMALEKAKGQYVAIIDDDEVPVQDWLLQLYKTLHAYNADAVFGSVLPVFAVDPPQWITKGKIFYWRDEKRQTGTLISKGATNNVLFKKYYADKYNLRFDPIFAQSGGCDEDFFRRLKRQGRRFVACNEAIVYEYFPSDRCRPDYIKKRNILEGCALVRIIRKEKDYLLFCRRFCQALLTIAITVLCYPLLLCVGKNIRAVPYYKCCFHAGVILEMLRLSPYKDRKSIGLQGK